MDISPYVPVLTATALPHVGGICGVLIASSQVSAWYETLKKPSWQLPDYLWAPVWTSLDSSMGIAAYLVWRDGHGFSGDAKLPLIAYGANLALNWLWSPLFFGAHKIGLALAEISVLWGTVGACTYLYWQVNRTASYLMMPYWAWLTFATACNYVIWKENCSKKD